APNIAARLQALAGPDQTIISAASYALVDGYFLCERIGQQTLKGIAKPIEVYRVLGESGAHSRFEVVAKGGLTTLVGREEEIALLRNCWKRTKEGQGQAALIIGEAGIGKSRLVHELKEHVLQEGYTKVEFRHSPYHENTAYYPIIEHLYRLL